MRVIYPKSHPIQTYDLYWICIVCIETDIFYRGQLQISMWQLQNNSVNGAMSISINRVISKEIYFSKNDYEWVRWHITFKKFFMKQKLSLFTLGSIFYNILKRISRPSCLNFHGFQNSKLLELLSKILKYCKRGVISLYKFIHRFFSAGLFNFRFFLIDCRWVLKLVSNLILRIVPCLI